MGSLQAVTCITPLLHFYSLQHLKQRKMKVFLTLSVLVLVFGFSNGKTFLVETAGPKKDGNTIKISLPKERRGLWDGHNINVEGHGFNKGESNELCIGNVCNGRGIVDHGDVVVRGNGQNIGGSNELCIGNFCKSRKQANIDIKGHGENKGESNELCIGNFCNGRGIVDNGADIVVRGNGQNIGGSNELCIGNVCNSR